MADEKQRVIFLCTHNSARSQMAEGWLRHLGGARFDVYSAGTEATNVRPLATRAMADVGVDISAQQSTTVAQHAGDHWDYVITVCSQVAEACPFLPGRHRMHWPLPDPSRATGTEEEQLRVYRQVRDELREHIEAFIANAV